MTEWRRENMGDDPSEYIPTAMDITPEEVIDIAKESETLFEVTQRTRLTRHQVRRILSLGGYDDVISGFGNDHLNAKSTIDRIREQFD